MVNFGDLLAPKLTISPLTPLPRWRQFAPKSIRSFSKYRVHKTSNKRTEGRPVYVENIIQIFILPYNASTQSRLVKARK